MFKVNPNMIYNGGYFNVEENRVMTNEVILSIRDSFLSPEEKVILQEETLICYLNRPYDFSQIKEILINGIHFKRFFRNLFENGDFYYKIQPKQLFQVKGQWVLFLKVAQAELHQDFDKHHDHFFAKYMHLQKLHRQEIQQPRLLIDESE